MKLVVLLKILFPSIFFLGTASAKQDCPDLIGRYSIHAPNPAFVDAGKLWKLNLVNFSSGEVEIRGNSLQELSFFWKKEKDGVMPTRASSEWTFSRDYKCNDGWVVFSHRPPSYRNDLPGLYEGEAKIRITRDDLYDGLKIESEFSGHETVSLFSYESANISIPKWWSRKTVRDTIVLDTAPVDPSWQAAKTDSQAMADVRRMLSKPVLGGVMLGAFEEREGAVSVTLTALRASYLKSFEERLHAAAIPYQMKIAPVWTNNSYFLEILVSTKH